MSFTNAPVTRTLVVGLVSSSLAASLFDLKYYFYILVNTHIWKYHQPWRALIFQLCYTNSSEVLFGAMTLYNMRVVERMWGSRKYAVSQHWNIVHLRRANTDSLVVVLPHRRLRNHQHRHSDYFDPFPQAYDGWPVQLPARGSHATNLCCPLTIPCNNPTHLQISDGFDDGVSFD